MKVSTNGEEVVIVNRVKGGKKNPYPYVPKLDGFEFLYYNAFSSFKTVVHFYPQTWSIVHTVIDAMDHDATSIHAFVVRAKGVIRHEVVKKMPGKFGKKVQDPLFMAVHFATKQG